MFRRILRFRCVRWSTWSTTIRSSFTCRRRTSRTLVASIGRCSSIGTRSPNATAKRANATSIQSLRPPWRVAFSRSIVNSSSSSALTTLASTYGAARTWSFHLRYVAQFFLFFFQSLKKFVSNSWVQEYDFERCVLVLQKETLKREERILETVHVNRILL